MFPEAGRNVKTPGTTGFPQAVTFSIGSERFEISASLRPLPKYLAEAENGPGGTRPCQADKQA